MTGQRPTTLWGSSKSELRSLIWQIWAEMPKSSHHQSSNLLKLAQGAGACKLTSCQGLRTQIFWVKQDFPPAEKEQQWLSRVGGAKEPIACKLSSSLMCSWELRREDVTKEIWKKCLVLKQQKITWEEHIWQICPRGVRAPHSACARNVKSDLEDTVLLWDLACFL